MYFRSFLFLSLLILIPLSSFAQTVFTCNGIPGNFPGYVLYNEDKRVEFFPYFKFDNDMNTGMEKALDACKSEGTRISYELQKSDVCLCGEGSSCHTDLYRLERDNGSATVLASFPDNCLTDPYIIPVSYQKCQAELRQLVSNGQCSN